MVPAPGVGSGWRLCENAQEPTRWRIIFSIALFSIAATALFLFRLTKSRRNFYAQIECLCFQHSLGVVCGRSRQISARAKWSFRRRRHRGAKISIFAHRLGLPLARMSREGAYARGNQSCKLVPVYRGRRGKRLLLIGGVEASAFFDPAFSVFTVLPPTRLSRSRHESDRAPMFRRE